MILLTTIPAPGCRAPRVRERPFPERSADQASTWRAFSSSVDPTSSDQLAYSQLSNEIERTPHPSPVRILELADRADAIGSRLIRNNPSAALPWFREAAAYASFGLISARSDNIAYSLRDRAIARHNHAVQKLLRSAGSGPKQVNPVWREQLAACGVTIAVSKPECGAIPCDELWIASDFQVKNLNHVGWTGMGVPLISLSRFPDRTASPDRFLPERLRLPTTAVLYPTGSLKNGAWRSRPTMLVLHDPAHESSVTLSPSVPVLPLAADLTTPLAHQIIRSPLKQLSWGGLLRPETYNSMPGIFMGRPYQAGRIPVLFVHGLWSSPDAWLKMTNDLQADPLIRERYQFWYAFYPTGAPLMFSAARIRQTLHELRDTVDPGHHDPALDKMVVVGHRLGGVLSKQLLQSSDRILEQGLLTRPLEQVTLSPRSRSELSHLLYFEPEPSIRRAIFICDLTGEVTPRTERSAV